MATCEKDEPKQGPSDQGTDQRRKVVRQPKPYGRAQSRRYAEHQAQNEETVISGSREPEEDDLADIASKESFPASDPPATY
jgi:hypothetical protein